MIIFTLLLAFLILTTTSVSARRRPLKGKEVGYDGAFQNETLSAEAVDCDGSADYSCKYSINQEDGVFVCRSWINKRGVELKKVGCFPSNRALLGTDECGCCGKECPTICNTCPCSTKQGRYGAYIVYDGRDEPVCRSTFMATKLVHRDDSISCLADCDFAR